MENLMISKYMKLFELMSLELKIELLSRLADSIKSGYAGDREPDKKELSRELFGAWADMDDDITKHLSRISGIKIENWIKNEVK